MKPMVLGLCSIWLAACFDEGGNDVQTESALAMAEGLLAFPDIHNNVSTDPGAAGVALLAWIKTPIAANNLVQPPFALPGASARIAAPAPVPDCLVTSGPSGCDSFTTSTSCDAGPISFSGNASRTCSPCENVAGACTYDWDISLTYTLPTFTMSLSTTGPATVSATEVTVDSRWMFDLTTEGGAVAGQVRIRSCGPAPISMGPPRRLVNARFIVTNTVANRCADVRFDAAGDVTVGEFTGSCEDPQC